MIIRWTRLAALAALALTLSGSIAHAEFPAAATSLSNAAAVSVGTTATTVLGAPTVPTTLDLVYAHDALAIATVAYTGGAAATTITCGGSNGWSGTGTVNVPISTTVELTVVAIGTQPALGTGTPASAIAALTCVAGAAGNSVPASGANALYVWGASRRTAK